MERLLSVVLLDWKPGTRKWTRFFDLSAFGMVDLPIFNHGALIRDCRKTNSLFE